MRDIIDRPSVRPFCDVFYYNCKYNPVLSALYHYSGTVLPFVANHLTYVRCSDEDGLAEVVRAQRYDELDVVRRMGIEVKIIERIGDELGDVWRETLATGGLLYVPVDLYVLPGYGDYGKTHWGHWFLVTAEGDRRKDVVVIEGDDREGVHAGQRQLSMERLSEAHGMWMKVRQRWGKSIGFHGNDWKDELSVFRGRKARSMTTHCEAAASYLDLVRMCREEMERGMREAARSGWQDCFREAVMEKDYDWQGFATRMKRIARFRRTEAYKICAFFGSDDVAKRALDDSARVLDGIVFHALRAATSGKLSGDPARFVTRFEQVLSFERDAIRSLIGRSLS